MEATVSPMIERAARPRWFVPVLLVVLALLALLTYGLASSDRSQPTGGPAPDFTLQTLDGQQIALSELKGRPVVLNFWASWCRECDAEMAALQASADRYGDDVVFLGVAYTDSEAKARGYLEQYGMTYANGLDLGARISDAYRIRGVPETFFIGRDGTVKGLKIGPLDPTELDARVQDLLGAEVSQR